MRQKKLLFMRLLSPVSISPMAKWLAYGVMIGVVSGLGAILFDFGLEWTSHVFVHGLLDHHPPATGEIEIFSESPVVGNRWLLFVIPTLGALVSGFLVYTFAPEAEGHGTDAAIRAFHFQDGLVRHRVPIIKSIASMVVIGTGGSAGREGPIAQIGSGFASWLADAFRLSVRDRRLMLLAGMAGGIGAIFRAPLGGAIFACEVLYYDTDIEAEGAIPCTISSIVAYSVFYTVTGKSVLFATQPHRFDSIYELPLYGVLGVVCAIVGIFYVWVLYRGRDRVFKRLPISPILRTALGGLLLGGLAFFRPEVLSGGYGYVQQAINGGLALYLMAILVVAKILATTFTISSGGSGGVFGPSLYIGAMVGGVCGKVFEHFWSDVIPIDSSAFVLVGMGGFFAGIAKVPFAALIMVAEMTGSYGLLVPMMLVCAVTYVCTARTRLYEEQVRSRIESPVHRGEMQVDLLDGLYVKELPLKTDVHCLRADVPLRDILPMIPETQQNYFPVLGEDGQMCGIFSMDDIRQVLYEGHIGDLVIAGDIALTEFIYLVPDEDLHSALKKFTGLNLDELPVLE
ncbi:MAG: chloride channel protein, partial [bacterium]